jgi:hypothetical protein
MELTDEDSCAVMLRVVWTQRLSVLLLISHVFVVLKQVVVLQLATQPLDEMYFLLIATQTQWIRSLYRSGWRAQRRFF